MELLPFFVLHNTLCKKDRSITELNTLYIIYQTCEENQASKSFKFKVQLKVQLFSSLNVKALALLFINVPLCPCCLYCWGWGNVLTGNGGISQQQLISLWNNCCEPTFVMWVYWWQRVRGDVCGVNLHSMNIGVTLAVVCFAVDPSCLMAFL